MLHMHSYGRYCSPTRRSFLSGRFPNRISTAQPDGDKLCSDFLPLNCTILSEKLATGGYESHFIGKGHLGYQTMDHLPINRGFTSHVGFLAGSETCAHALCLRWCRAAGLVFRESATTSRLQRPRRQAG